MRRLLLIALLLLLTAPAWAATANDANYVPGSTGTFDYRTGADRTYAAQSFVAGHTESITNIILKVKRSGTLTGNAHISVQTDSSGVPSGTEIGTSDTYAGSAFSTSTVDHSFACSTPIPMTAGQTYHLVLIADWSIDAGNYLIMRLTTNNGYADGNESTYNGSVWAAQANGHAYAHADAHADAHAYSHADSFDFLR
jgi:hypothetical protein